MLCIRPRPLVVAVPCQMILTAPKWDPKLPEDRAVLWDKVMTSDYHPALRWDPAL